MIKRLTERGDSLTLVIDRPVLELLRIHADTPLSVTTDGDCLIIVPIRDDKEAEGFS